MMKKKGLNEFIFLLPMPVVIADYNGVLIESNDVFKHKFHLSKISNKNKIKLQTFFNFDIANIVKRIANNQSSVSTYDYKFTDLNENEVIVDLHFNSIQSKKILIIIQEKDNFKTHLTQASKIFGDLFMKSFSKSLGRNISVPITNILGSLELIAVDNNKEQIESILKIIHEESNKIKDYLRNIYSLDAYMSLSIEKSNIHECLNIALERLNYKFLNQVKVTKFFDPSIPEILFNKEQLIICFINILLNAFEVNKNCNIRIFTEIKHNIFIRSDELQKVLKLPIHIKIVDDGPGVDDDIEKFMFYPFISKKANSEGLGLTYVNLIVSRHGGYLKYEREKNNSSFNIYLPLVKDRRV